MANYDMFPDLLRDDTKSGNDSSRDNSQSSVSPADTSPASGNSSTSASASPASSPTPPDPNDLLPALPTFDTAYGQQAQTTQDMQNQDMANLLVSTALTRDALDKSNTIYDSALTAKATTDQQQMDIYGGLNDTIQKANVAMKLSDSSDPMDHLKLWSMQLTDPLYTDTGNEARLQYYRDASGTVAAKSAVEQDSYQNQIDQLKQSITKQMQPGEDLATILKLQTAQGSDRIAALENLQQSRVATLKAQDDMQTHVLSQMDDKGQLQSLLTMAKNSPSQSINQNGVTLSAGQIDDRLTQITDRQYVQSVQANTASNIAVSDMQMPDVIKYEAQALASPAGSVNINGTKVSLGAIQDRKRALQSGDLTTTSQELAVRGQAQNLIDATDNRFIATHTMPELVSLKQNGGVASDGHIIPMDKINNEIMKRQQDQLTQITQAASIASVGDIGQAGVDLNNRLNAVLTHADPNSPLAAQVRSFKDSNALVHSMTDPSKNPNSFTQAWGAATIHNLSSSVLPKAIQTEATRIAGQDKELGQAYTYMLQGQPIPSDLTRGVLTSRLINGKDRLKWLSVPDNGFLTIAYGDALQKLRTDAFKDNPISAPDLTTMKQEAANSAIDQLVAKQSTGLTNQIWGNQVTAKNNPLGPAGVTSNKIQELIHGSDQTGIKNYISANNVPKDQADLLMANGANALAGQPNAQIQLSVFQNAALLQNLDQLKPGLSKQYMDWWNSQDSTDYIGKYVQNQLGRPAQTMQDYVAFSQQLPKIGDAISAYGQGLQQGDDLNYQSQYDKEHKMIMTFQGNPTNGQLFLLDVDKNLTDTEKQQAMQTIIQPLLTDAQQQNKGYGDTMSYIDSQLRDMRPDDPVTKKLLNKILAHREDSYKPLESLMNLQDFQLNNPLAAPLFAAGEVNPVFGLIQQATRRFSIATGAVPNPIDQAGANVAWYQNMGGSK